MDYSAISHADHPAGSSPWDSPGAERTTFTPSNNNDIPSSPLPPQDHSPYDADHHPETPNPQQPRESDSPDLSERLQSAQLGDPDYGVEQSPYGAPHQQQRSHPATRYQSGARQPSKQPAPAYRIQAKITGLERTGKKDPVLRFDVHVSKFSLEAWYLELTSRPDKCPEISHYPVSRRPTYTFRIRKTCRTSIVGES